MPAFINLTNLRFGRWTVLRYDKKVGRYSHWLCRCECGFEASIRASSLRSGNSTGCFSCGQIGNDKTETHGHTSRGRTSATYESWKAMKARCLTPTNASYRWYGGRGIKVCDRWMHFENFLADMGERPNHTTIDRRDSDGNYELSNCRWSTQVIQRENQR
jgi:hypothetical protein